jgi:hypothetical protein
MAGSAPFNLSSSDGLFASGGAEDVNDICSTVCITETGLRRLLAHQLPPVVPPALNLWSLQVHTCNIHTVQYSYSVE